MNTKKIGIVTEAKVIARLLELGYTVFTPVGGYGPCDAIAELDGRMLRGQIKTARQKTSSLAFSTIDCGRNRKSYEDVVDVFWVYAPFQGKIYQVPAKGAPIGTMCLRITDTCIPGRRNTVNYAKDYEI